MKIDSDVSIIYKHKLLFIEFSKSLLCDTERKICGLIENSRMLEVCVDSLESALNAIRGGADELEVCSSLLEGGLTPSAGLVQQIVHAVESSTLDKTYGENATLKISKRPKVNVMLRCRTGSDFHYSRLEMDTMLSDLQIFNTMNIDRFVFGAVDEKQHVDKEYCTEIIDKAAGKPVTFHRAFDICVNPETALEKLIEIGFSRVLTSGQKTTAVDNDAVKLIKKLLDISAGRIEIMPGAGLNAENVTILKDIGCSIFHGSCKKKKLLPNACLALGSNESECIYVTDEVEVRNMKLAITG